VVQEKFAAGIAGFLKTVSAHNAATREAEIGRLGENAKGRIDAVNKWIDGRLGNEGQALKGLPLTAEVIVALEKAMVLAGDPSVIGGGTSPASSAAGAKAEIARLQADPEFQKSILNRSHPQHTENMKKLTELHTKAAMAA
jgi:hypothetical protein